MGWPGAGRGERQAGKVAGSEATPHLTERRRRRRRPRCPRPRSIPCPHRGPGCSAVAVAGYRRVVGAKGPVAGGVPPGGRQRLCARLGPRAGCTRRWGARRQGGQERPQHTRSRVGSRGSEPQARPSAPGLPRSPDGRHRVWWGLSTSWEVWLPAQPTEEVRGGGGPRAWRAAGVPHGSGGPGPLPGSPQRRFQPASPHLAPRPTPHAHRSGPGSPGAGPSTPAAPARTA